MLPLMLALALQAAAPIAVQTLATDSMSQIEEPQQAVARTPAEWAQLWRKHAGDKTPPKVDFGSQMVVAVFLGSRSSAGYAVEILGTQQAGGVLTIEWRERRPDPGDVVAQVMTSPSHLAAIPKFAGEVRFKKVTP